MSLISRFISEQGKILSRLVNRLNLKQQRLITSAIKQAHILSLLPFLNNEKQFERGESTAKTTGLRIKNRQATLHLNWNGRLVVKIFCFGWVRGKCLLDPSCLCPCPQKKDKILGLKEKDINLSLKYKS